MIDRVLWDRFYQIYTQYRKAWTRYLNGEIRFDLDEIADGILPLVLSSLFAAWFPNLANEVIIEEVEGGSYEYYGYEGYEYWWSKTNKEGLYQLFDEALKETLEEGV